MNGITPYNFEYQGVLCTGVDWEDEAFEFEHKGKKYFYKQIEEYDCVDDLHHIQCVIEEFLGWLGEVKKLINRYNAQILNDKGEYHLQFETNSRENFNAMEKLAQKCIDNKPRTNFDKIVESVESLAKKLVNMSLNGDFVPCFYAPDGTEFAMDEERAIQYTIEWLQKECENG